METSRVEEECTYLTKIPPIRLVTCFIPDGTRVRSSIKVIQELYVICSIGEQVARHVEKHT